ncbi:protease-4 [Roseibium hamelinense]|uniref:Protease-4 n=1 Tax=Roseibium hamelinense TaxID=150831 RepID=A0A562T121_9HYPH|nr:signal peptide peptidase SppA [Roseibium hamelinense]MTI44556.1 signal peptide peptidase SppA [Roseibium hamelinense]TWI87182.1 protease-4 [Roseibium hamelinense]
MSLDADALVDRRRMRRKLTFWRVAAFAILAIALIAGIAYAAGIAGLSKRSPHVARIAVEGVIVDNRDLLDMIEKISEANAVEGVILSINSPGGSTTGGEGLYDALRKLSDKKPLVAEIRTVGASAGYMIALASDHIVARYNSITGSIGVLFQYGNIEKLLDTVGVSMDAVKSASLKAEPDFYSETTPEARAVLERLVNDSFDWFVALVAERRPFDDAKARELADGSIYSGHAAMENGLIDAIGGEDTAIAWLENERNVPRDLPIVTWSPSDETSDLPFAASLSRAFGEGIAKGMFPDLENAKGLISRGFALDGLVSVWQAPVTADNISKNPGGGND